uniref:PH domain-containing protein n=1 Tax=Ciona savignyi TaxID=51511 RepID=H2Z805_CIOSA
MIILDEDRSSFHEENFQPESNLKSSHSDYNLLADMQGKAHYTKDSEHSSAPPPHPMIERQGRLYWTKLVEAGKKQRKNWIQQWVVLLANNLLFYKDQKQAVMVQNQCHTANPTAAAIYEEQRSTGQEIKAARKMFSS